MDTGKLIDSKIQHEPMVLAAVVIAEAIYELARTIRDKEMPYDMEGLHYIGQTLEHISHALSGVATAIEEHK